MKRKIVQFFLLQIPGQPNQWLKSLSKNFEAKNSSVIQSTDAGAGKSEFSFYLSWLFINHRLTVKYFSLEMGINETIKQKLIKFKLTQHFYISGQGDLDEVKKDASKYDIIIVDSFGKLNAVADDLDRLRHQFPNTIFVFIFRKNHLRTNAWW